MNAALRRLESLERTQEWHEAFAGIERVLTWATVSGQCSAAEAAGHLSEMKAAVPLSQFVAGRWTAPPDWIPRTREDATKTSAMLAVFSEWEQAQGITP